MKVRTVPAIKINVYSLHTIIIILWMNSIMYDKVLTHKLKIVGTKLLQKIGTYGYFTIVLATRYESLVF